MTDFDPELIASSWGKAPPGHRDPPYHPLVYHSMDASAMAEALLTARPELIQALADLSGLDRGTARAWFLFAVAMHDLGKFAFNFQNKVPEFCREKNFSPVSDLAFDHGAFGWALWHELTGQKSGRHYPSRLSAWVHAACCHHGSIFGDDEYRYVDGYIAETAKHHARLWLEFCDAHFLGALPRPMPEGLKPAEKGPELWLVAGLIVLADWLGSDKEIFKYHTPDMSLKGYWQHSLDAAQMSINKNDLKSASIAADFGLTDIFPKDVVSPTALQQWAMDVALPEGPILAVLEDMTGSGKSEAAVLLAHRMMQAEKGTGLYWALPTMATANGLYPRLNTFYRQMFSDRQSPSLVLAHSGADLESKFMQTVRQNDGMGDGCKDPTSAYCNAWYTEDRRRALWADIGVGTIDQALLAILPVKFQSLRLAALARKIIIVDEAHSYEPYVNKLMSTLLAFHRRLGGSAIILSATLDSKTRETLVRCFEQGTTENNTAPPPRMPFPHAELIEPGNANDVDAVRHQPARPIVQTRGSAADLSVIRHDSEQAVLESLAAHNAQGRCALWVRNTVHDAMAAFEMVRATLPTAEVILFHARFIRVDRNRIENAVLERLDKSSLSENRRNLIVVATQVVEQSLDLDADAMVTDLAPLDVLIQRAGRLHRHNRSNRPPPVLEIYGPAASDTVAADWFSKCFAKGQYVYPNNVHLWRTMRLLEHEGLPLKTGNTRDMLDSVFKADNDDAPQALHQRAEKSLAKNLSWSAVASGTVLATEKGFKANAVRFEDDVLTPTREGEPVRIVRLAKWQNGLLLPFADGARGDTPQRLWRLSEIGVRASKLGGRAPLEAALEAAVEKTEATWPKNFRPLLLPLIQEDDGRWFGSGLDQNQQKQRVCYEETLGLWLEL